MKKRLAILACALGAATPAFALNILISNDDGLTSNVKALYDALKAEGHDVVASLPCTNQSSRGAGAIMYSTDKVVPDNDSAQINAASGCRSGAAPIGAPAVGQTLRAGLDNGDFHYVHGTPIMATLYGLDVVAKARWGKAPDVLLSGPNEGPNLGSIINSSGTVSNAQWAGSRGIPAIALSAGTNTVDDTNLANPLSPVIAKLSVQLLKALQAKAGSGALLPRGIALNVNFPKAVAADTPFAFSRIGTYDAFNVGFKNTVPYGLTLSLGGNGQPPTAAQMEDESVVYLTKTAVSAMQVGFEARPAGQEWLRLRLRDVFAK